MTAAARKRTAPPRKRRIPTESQRPLTIFAWSRLILALLALAVVALLGFPFSGRLAVLIAAVALPWSLANLLLAWRAPAVAINPAIAVGDVLMLVAIQAAVPETFAAVRFMALAFLAVHAHFQGERIAAAVAAVAVPALVTSSALAGSGEVDGRLLVFYEAVFALAAFTTAVVVGAFRTAESAARLRARDLTRRTMRTEGDIRRRVSQALHDGPVQELIGLDIALAATQREASREGARRTAEMLDEAREMTTRNVRALRDEMVSLGPYALEELSDEEALERWVPLWERRFGLEATLSIAADHELPSETQGDLFRITQEAVVNAAKHGAANRVRISLACAGDRIELAIADDGHGFEGVDPLQPTAPGHLGLASMRERAELLDGMLHIDSSEEGTTVVVSAPRPQ